jgi:ubiquinone/menaquinone biosynthesis C-methylase UbiE
MTCRLKGVGFRMASPGRTSVLFMICILLVLAACDKSSTETIDNLSAVVRKVMKAKPRPIEGSSTRADYKPPPLWPERVRKINRGNIPGIENIHENYLDLAAEDEWWRQEIEKYKAVIPLGTGEVRTAIDVGSGTGSFSVAAEKFGMTVLNADTITEGQPYLHIVAERGLLGIIHDARHNHLPLVDHAVDMVHCNNVFHWFAPREIPKILAEWDRVLRPKGYVILLFHQIRLHDPEAKGHRAMVAAVEETAQNLKWKTLKIDKWTPQSSNQETVRYYFQKSLAGDAAYSLSWGNQLHEP